VNAGLMRQDFAMVCHAFVGVAPGSFFIAGLGAIRAICVSFTRIRTAVQERLPLEQVAQLLRATLPKFWALLA
jgi:hypothetical protein